MVDTADCMTVRRDKCDVICQNCFQDLSKPIITCKGCNRAKFCGILCFRKGNDSFHKYECALWASMEETPHETLVMHSRAMLRMKIDQDFHDTIMALHHFDGPETMMESALELKKWSEAIKTHAPGMVPEGFDYPDIRRVYLALKMNAFSIMKYPFGRSYAGGLFPKLCLLNHSCAPNCSVEGIPGFKMQLIAMVPINVGEELTISYEGSIQRKEVRQWNLKAKYQFDCECPACLNEEIVEWDDDEEPLRRLIRMLSSHPKSRYAIAEAAEEFFDVFEDYKGPIPMPANEVATELFLCKDGNLRYLSSNSFSGMYTFYIHLIVAAHKSAKYDICAAASKKLLQLIDACCPNKNVGEVKLMYPFYLRCARGWN